MKYAQQAVERLGQANSVITFDEAIYAKAKEIQWRRPDEFKATVLRLGGFHMAMVFLAVIGKRHAESGLEDILIESKAFGPTTVDAIMRGKMYNRSIRAHKMVYEAMQRLLWKEFGDWCLKNEDKVTFDEELVTVLAQECANAVSSKVLEASSQSMRRLSAAMGKLERTLEQFTEYGISKSATFAFWREYIVMIEILLQFIRAERSGNWTMHLAAVTEMLPYFFAYDHVNYSRWAMVYLADMKLLPTTAPLVHRQFLEGNFSIKRSSSPFNKVWSDMAFEQSVNRDSKTKGGVVGLTQSPTALVRWFLTANKHAEAVSAVKGMCDLDEDRRARKHKEFGTTRMARDERDVEAITSITIKQMVVPFQVDTNNNESRLVNIATGVLASQKVEQDLLNARKTGKEAAKLFAEEQMNTTTKSVFDKITKTSSRHLKEIK